MAWWKYSRYEVRDERICPRPKARLKSYDPWAEYESAKRNTGESPPYVSLLNLLKEIQPDVFLQEPADTIPSPPFLNHPTRGLLVRNYHNRLSTLPKYARKVPSIQFSERAIKRILEWTDHYGLLGILPQRILLLQAPALGVPPNVRGNFARVGGLFWFFMEETNTWKVPQCVLFPRTTEPLAVIVPAATVVADFDLQKYSRPWMFDF